MSVLRIELLTRERHTGDARDDSYVAFCCYEGELLSKAGIGAGQTERAAAQESINSYFARREAAETPSTTFTLTSPVITFEPASSTPGAGSLLGRVTSDRGIRALLQDAIASNPTPKLILDYEDYEGTRTEREIYPSAMDEARGLRGFREVKYLKAVDVAKDEPRTFRIDRIRGLEYADA